MGLFDKETARQAKKIRLFAAGNTDDLMTQYVRFQRKRTRDRAITQEKGTKLI
jgi:hypothetical protein